MISSSVKLWALGFYFTLQSTYGIAENALQNEASILRKVIGITDTVIAATTITGEKSAYTLEPLKPYFILADEGKHFKITNKQSGGQIAYVKKDQVREWNTREGLHFSELHESGDRAEVKVWQTEETIKKYLSSGDDKENPPYLKEDRKKTEGKPEKFRPYPVLGQGKSKFITGSDKKYYHVLAPVHLGASLSGNKKVVLQGTKEEIRQALSRISFVIVFDASSSMEKYAKETGESVSQILEIIAPQQAGNAKAGFLFFRDIDDSKKYEIFPFQPLSEAGKLLLEKAVPEFMVGGGSPPEPILDAAYIGAGEELAWPNDGSKKVMLLIGNTDAKLKTIGLSSRVPLGLEVEQVARHIKSQGISNFFALQAGESDGGSLVKTLKGLADQTGGEFFPFKEDMGSTASTVATKIKQLLGENITTSTEEAGNIINQAQEVVTSAGAQTVLALNTLSKDEHNRLMAFVGQRHLPDSQFVVQDGWLIDREELYSQKILIEKPTLEMLSRIFNALAETTIGSSELLAGLRANLQGLIGEDIPQETQLQDLVEKKVGIHFNTEVLGMTLEQFQALTPQERRNLQARFKKAANSLNTFLEANTVRFTTEESLWMDANHLP